MLNDFIRSLGRTVKTTIPYPVLDRVGLANSNDRYDFLAHQILVRTTHRGSVCLDVGCHRGEVLQQMLAAAPEGEFYCFEPLPRLFEQLDQRYASDPRVHVHSCALSNVEGSQPFMHVLDYPAYSGLRRRQYPKPDVTVQEIGVQTRRLDDVLPKGVRVDFIKVDVEGAEDLVFRGAERVLSESTPVMVFEYGRGAACQYGSNPSGTWDFLASCGLAISRMEDFLELGPTLTREAFAESFIEGRDYYFVAHPPALTAAD